MARTTSLIVVLSLLFVACNAWWSPLDALRSDKWDDLRIKWGLNPFRSFLYLPRTAAAAIEDGYQLISHCATNVPWRGSRYIKNNDYTVVLLFDVNGIIAGIQTAFTQEQGQGYPPAAQQPPFVRDGDRFVLSAYFVDPSIICSTGRTEAQLNSEGTGTGLYIQHTNNPEESTLVPKNEADIGATPWVLGKCFRTMGNHYWYGVSENMNCDNAFPMFLLYNNGELNAFGWFLLQDMQIGQYEHPPKAIYNRFIDVVPTCLRDIQISTLHIFLTHRPLLNFC